VDLGQIIDWIRKGRPDYRDSKVEMWNLSLLSAEMLRNLVSRMGLTLVMPGLAAWSCIVIWRCLRDRDGRCVT